MTATRNKKPKTSSQGHRNRSQKQGKVRPGERRKHPTPGTTITLRSPDNVLLYGRNAVEAALKNPARKLVRLMATAKNRDWLESNNRSSTVRVDILESIESIIPLLPEGAPHQGVFLETRPLDESSIEDFRPLDGQKNVILMLDQVTDPQNVGACLRSAAAFGARALITQDRNSPGESGVLARASAGGLEVIPWVRAVNLAQALETLKDMGYWHVGLDGNTEASLKSADLGDNVVIVMGSEGKGLRPLVLRQCDLVVKIPMSGAVESLNVSNAAAIALYELT